MSDLGIISADDLPQSTLHMAVANILQGLEAEVFALLAARRAALERTVAILLDTETIGGDEFRALLAATTN